MSNTHPFRMVNSNFDVAVGQVLTFADGSKGKVTSIQSVKFLTMMKVEVVGRVKPIKV